MVVDVPKAANLSLFVPGPFGWDELWTSRVLGLRHLSGFVAVGEVHDDAVLDIIFGKFNPTAILPFEMPSSMQAVENQFEDVPFDSKDPIFPFGHGLNYHQ